jgi:hypothetical protein
MPRSLDAELQTRDLSHGKHLLLELTAVQEVCALSILAQKRSEHKAINSNHSIYVRECMAMPPSLPKPKTPKAHSAEIYGADFTPAVTELQ